MIRASQQEQYSLLQLGQVDKQLAQVVHLITHHPLRGECVNKKEIVERVRTEIKKLESEQKDAQSQADAIAQKTAALVSVIEQKEEKLNAGIGLTSRDLLVLQGEIDEHRMLLSHLEEEELAFLEKIENIEQKLHECNTQLLDAVADFENTQTELEKEISRCEEEKSTIMKTRADLCAQIPPALLHIYQEFREEGGIGVLAVSKEGVAQAGIDISAMEKSRLAAMDLDEVYVSEELEAILIRQN